ncbi:MAG TPA: adenylate/guanylate cyclase domain-containing protein [Thermoanaerobaculia bacterium]|nr:adenylate/guanylate cyclase domain-containing protein [Thermoanaerobaculia bacterium]
MLFDARLRSLLDSRDEDAVWDAYGETWCIMATDLSGFSRGVAERGIVHYLRIIHESERLLLPVIERHGGKLLKVEGDSLFAIFARANEALRAAIEMQRAARRFNDDKPEPEHVLLGIGLGYGRVLRIAEAEVYGNEVNSACILGETFAKAYEILITQSVRDEVDEFAFEPFEQVPPGARGAYRVLYSSSSDALNGD